jgi:Glycosyltransferase GT-D fold
VNQYPSVVNERATLERVLAGKSLTRFGDGEFRLAMGGARNISQVAHPRLKQELADILVTRQHFCLIAIPDMNPASPKWWFWGKYKNKYPRMLDDKITYYSQFITRPDSAPAIDTPEFYDRLDLLWRDQEVVLVRGSERSLVEGRVPLSSAKVVHTVLCARRDAYQEIDRVESEVLALGIRRVLLCAGAMATVLTYRLAKRGLHAIDLGHIGYLWRYYEVRQRAADRISREVRAMVAD